jgi:hypothetical protein
VDLQDDPPALVHLFVPDDRRVARDSPWTRLEETVIDLVDDSSTAEQAVDVVMRACQRRLTTAGRLSETARQRRKLRRRQLLLDLLTDVRAGAAGGLQ